jgi:hypothetical protein
MKYRFFYLLIISDIISNFTLYCLYVLVSQADSGLLIAIIFAFLISAIKIYFFIYVFNHFKDKTLIEINQTLLGEFFGKIISYIYIFLCLIVGFFMYKGLVEIIKDYMLITSPLLLISMVLIIIHAIVLENTSSTFLQAIAFTSVLMIIGITAQIIESSGQVQRDYLIGSILHSIGIPKFTGIATSGFFFGGAYHLSLFNPEFKKISYKKTIILIALVGFFTAFITVFIPLSIWGPEAAKKLIFVWISTADTMSIDLFIIERALFLMLPLYFLLAMSNTLIYSFVSYGLFCKLHPSPKLSKYTKVFICTTFVAGSMLIRNTEEVFKNASLWMIVWYVFHLLLSILLYIKTKGKEKSKE